MIENKGKTKFEKEGIGLGEGGLKKANECHRKRWGSAAGLRKVWTPPRWWVRETIRGGKGTKEVTGQESGR